MQTALVYLRKVLGSLHSSAGTTHITWSHPICDANSTRKVFLISLFPAASMEKYSNVWLPVVCTWTGAV
jgi:hypothetical protein